jgi:hypothetical protein
MGALVAVVGCGEGDLLQAGDVLEVELVQIAGDDDGALVEGKPGEQLFVEEVALFFGHALLLRS